MTPKEFFDDEVIRLLTDILEELKSLNKAVAPQIEKKPEVHALNDYFGYYR